MALPKFNDTPKYELVIPSTQDKIKFRPFLVKEQKVLLIAMETQDQSQILNAIVDTIQSCIMSDINITMLTSFDIEYIFTQIRAKSVGEKSTIQIACDECERTSTVDIDLEKIKVSVVKQNMFLKLNDQYTVKLRYPKYQYMLNNEVLKNTDSMTESLYELIIGCLDKLQSDDDIILFDDESREEVNKFLESFTSKQFEEVVQFVQNMPKMSHVVEFNCEHCNHPNKITLQGINDFF